MGQGFKQKITTRMKLFFEMNNNGEVTAVTLWETAKATIAYSSQKKQKQREKKILGKKDKEFAKII